MIIALDVDGVIADCATAVHEAASFVLCKTSIPCPEYWHSYDFVESMLLSNREAAELFEQIRRCDTLPWRIRLYEGARGFVSRLQQLGHEVFFVTAPWRRLRSWIIAREELLETAFPGVDIVYTHAKHRQQFDWLVDDKASTVAALADRAVLFDQPWNRQADLPGVVRVRGYDGVLEWLDDIQAA